MTTDPVVAGDAASVVCSDERHADGRRVDPDLDLDRWRRLAIDCLAAQGAVGELSLVFVDEAAIADLNRVHMGGDGPTDVLSFPMDDDAQPGVPVLLGDVVVCPRVAAVQAGSHAGTVDDELALLVVHGILHVLGHDHAEPTGTERMRAAERDLLERHHWHGPAPDGFRHDHPSP